jgi:hypothetical protein
MYKHLLESAGDINWMAIFALITFVTIFTISVITAFKTSPDFIKKMSHLPLEDNIPQTSENSDHEK